MRFPQYRMILERIDGFDEDDQVLTVRHAFTVEEWDIPEILAACAANLKRKLDAHQKADA